MAEAKKSGARKFVRQNGKGLWRKSKFNQQREN